MPWQNQVAVITGGARGLGRASARALAARGAAVCINYTAHPDAAETLAAELRAAGARAIAARADVADAAAVNAMVARAETELGPVTILVNSAGIGWRRTLDEWEPEGWARLRAVNVDGTIHAIRAVLPGMRARRYGRIVNISSIASFGTVMPGNAFYASTKAEVNILTKRFAMELGPHGITVNAVAPGYIRTDMTQGNKSPAEWAETVAYFEKVTMMGRVGEPEDIANAVAFLAAPESAWLTAQVLAVDGGRMDFTGHG
jgi:3-oxoacyl-[acyl-carrier protein] reductase